MVGVNGDGGMVSQAKVVYKNVGGGVVRSWITVDGWHRLCGQISQIQF
jgi:hypothetical protein